MHDKKSQTNVKKQAFSELFISSLIYVAILGFFSEYTSIVYASSFSYLFVASIIMGILTSATFWLKNEIVERYSESNRLRMAFFVWLVMFFSKFVFVWAIDFVLGDAVGIFGYFGIAVVITSATLANKAADLIYEKL